MGGDCICSHNLAFNTVPPKYIHVAIYPFYCFFCCFFVSHTRAPFSPSIIHPILHLLSLIKGHLLSFLPAASGIALPDWFALSNILIGLNSSRRLLPALTQRLPPFLDRALIRGGPRFTLRPPFEDALPFGYIARVRHLLDGSYTTLFFRFEIWILFEHNVV